MCDEERFVLRNAASGGGLYESYFKAWGCRRGRDDGQRQGHAVLMRACRRGRTYHAFDVQKEAVERTAARLKEAGYENRATLRFAGHETMKEHVQSAPRVVMFNLGWLLRGAS